MKLGTKSVLFGAHCFFLHPWFVAAAWWQLYGFPFDPRLWVAFFVHDLGYLGKPDMDGEAGETHPFLGAKILGWLFDGVDLPKPDWNASWHARIVGRALNRLFGTAPGGNPPDRGGRLTWYCFSFYHSRFLAKRYGVCPSRLCVADKLAVALTPWWLYLPMVNWTGEIREYMKLAEAGKYDTMNITTGNQRRWFTEMTAYLRRWVAQFKDKLTDTWTPENK